VPSLKPVHVNGSGVKSPILKRSIVIAGHKTSVNLEAVLAVLAGNRRSSAGVRVKRCGRHRSQQPWWKSLLGDTHFCPQHGVSRRQLRQQPQVPSRQLMASAQVRTTTQCSCLAELHWPKSV
jgi:hypothetical protein